MQLILKQMREFYYWLCKLFNCNLVNILCAGMFLIAGFCRLAHAEAEQRHIDVLINRLTEIPVPDGSASVLLGNPEIVDVITQSSAALIVAGKRIGQVNLLVRDRDHKTTLNLLIDVKPADQTALTLFRGTTRADYSCLMSCVITSGISAGNVDAPIKGPDDVKPSQAK